MHRAILAISLLLGCQSAPQDVAPINSAAQPSPPIVIPSYSEPPTDCRPNHEKWVPGTPLRLPCERSEEPCDRVDNDEDGITDPHCGTIPCTDDEGCTYGNRPSSIAPPI